MSCVSVVLGAQWGDEGKGKMVDLLSKDVTAVCRCQGGNNAGHTVIHKDQEYFFHLLPSGLVNINTIGILGNGVVVDLNGLFEEIDNAKSKGLSNIESRLRISDRCHLVFKLHQEVDRLEEEIRGSGLLGTTKKGIGPTYSSKITRNGLRICDLMGDWNVFRKKFENLVAYAKRRYAKLNVNVSECLDHLHAQRNRLNGKVVDTVSLINKLTADPGQSILIEGAQSCMLDIDFGTYPYVTSSNCSIGGVCTGLGLPPSKIGEVYGVVKAYTTRVGSGPFPTELTDSVGEQIQEIGREWGVTTKRKRRVGWLDAVMVRYAHMVNGFTALTLTKLDVLDELDEVKIGHTYIDKVTNKEFSTFPADVTVLSTVTVVYDTLPGWKQSIQSCQSYADLPLAARNYIEAVERHCGVPIRWVGTGASRESIIDRHS